MKFIIRKDELNPSNANTLLPILISNVFNLFKEIGCAIEIKVSSFDLGYEYNNSNSVLELYIDYDNEIKGYSSTWFIDKKYMDYLGVNIVELGNNIVKMK